MVLGCSNGKGKGNTSGAEPPPGAVALAGDLSTRDGLRRALAARPDGEDSGDVCVKRAKGFAGAILVGSIAPDRGCMGAQVILGRWLYEDPKRGMAAVLGAAGFASATPVRRRELILAYLDEMSFNEPLRVDTPPEGFGIPNAPAYHPPKVESLDDGGVKVLAWYASARMTPGVSYRLVESRYGPDGTPVGGQIVARHDFTPE